MDGLRALDSVAYVRFASVYRNFREARDFNALIDELANGAGEAPEDDANPPRKKARSPSQA
jgi:transcriptional repressor NrdR